MRFLIFLFVFFAITVGPTSAANIPAIRPIVLTYDVYVGGIHLLTADAIYQQNKQRYHAHVIGQTYGIWNSVFPWHTDLDVDGAIRLDHFVPSRFTIHDIWGEKHKHTLMQFTKKDVKVSHTPPENESTLLTPAQKKSALDPVSAMLQLLAHVATTKNCNATVSIFDGKRLFDVTGTDKGDDMIDADDYGIYTGRARLCDVGFHAVAGEWSEKIKEKFWKKSDNGEDRDPFHVWLAPIDPALPEMAVRAETESAWGNIVVHLSAWRWVQGK